MVSHKGHVVVDRAGNGTLNLATLVPPPKREPKAAPVPPPAPAAPAEPWTVQVTKFALEEWSARFDDRVPERPVTLTVDGLALTVDNFALAKGTRFNVGVHAKVNRGGSVAVTGSVVLDPLAATLKIDAKGLDLLAVQPYFTDKINLLLTSGGVQANGDLTLATTAKGPRVTYKGRAGIDRLVAVEKSTSEDFLKWDSLFVTGVDVSTDPLAITIGQVALTQFYSRLAINADATLNLRGIAAAPGAAPEAAATPAPAAPEPAAPEPAAPAAAGPVVPVRINTVTLQGGTIDFADKLVKPNFSTSLKEVGGRISGLSSSENSVADLDLKAKLEDYAPLEISGKVNPLSKELAVDVTVSFHDIDVSPLSPYAGKYVGYTVSKGKLNLDLKYTIAQKKLSATNSLFVDQLTLGDRGGEPHRHQAARAPGPGPAPGSPGPRSTSTCPSPAPSTTPSSAWGA